MNHLFGPVRRSRRALPAGPVSFRRRGDRVPTALGLLALASLAAACVTTPAPPPAAPPVADYVVGAPDQLRINILPEPAINREARVRPDGMISIDLIGDVRAAGLTPEQIARSIEEKILRFKRDASVNVAVVDSPSQFVTVYGEVGAPGTFPLNTEMRISEAIGRVGGTKPFASENKIRIVRTTGGETQVIRVRLKDISRGDLSTNIAVAEGDLIVVPPTLLARIGYAVQMVFFPFQPLLSGASQVGGVAAGTILLSR
ncbi:polysaccharide export protein [Myxococcota bacterium]|nr:polysaccharide export protein [Myxococcota bacterium]